MRRAVRLLIWLLLIVAAIGALTQAAEVIAAEQAWSRHRLGQSIDRPVDAAIVLGASIDPDGQAGWESRRRVAAAVHLLQAGKARNLIFSGGGPTEWGIPTAAEMMRDHAIALGAPPDRLFLEPEASTTLQNLLFAFRIADAKGFRSLALVSDAFHLTRSWALAAWMGRPDVGLVSVDHRGWHWRPSDAILHVREAMAWWFNLGKVAAWEGLRLIGVELEEREQLVV